MGLMDYSAPSEDDSSSIEDFGTYLVQTINNLEEQYKLPKEFFRDFYKEGSWSFIIKAHALIEVATNRLIIEKLKSGKFQKIVERLPVYSKGEMSKIAILEAYDILRKKDYDFIKKMSNIRNEFAHSLEHISCGMDEYVASKDKSWKKSFVGSLDPIDRDKPSQEYNDFIIHNLTLAIWIRCILLVNSIHSEHKRLESMRTPSYGPGLMSSNFEFLKNHLAKPE